MVIIISYNKQTWNEYDDNQTAHKNLANGAIISADRLNHMEDGISNNDINKVADNKDGTVQINGHNIHPFDTVQNGSQPYGLDFNNYINSGNYRFDNVTTINYPPMAPYYNYWQLIVFGNGNSVYQITIGHNIIAMRQFFMGSGWGSWMQVADYANVVHSIDMRKPANDVAGIEEVNAKQDKLTITPADDSKVFHSTITQLNSTDMNTVLTAGFYRLASGTNGTPLYNLWFRLSYNR